MFFESISCFPVFYDELGHYHLRIYFVKAGLQYYARRDITLPLGLNLVIKHASKVKLPTLLIKN